MHFIWLRLITTHCIMSGFPRVLMATQLLAELTD